MLHRTEGFSLVETLIALTLLGVVVMSLAQLTSFSAHANVEARRISMATVLAADKLEDLRDAVSFPASPADALEQNRAGFCDFLDMVGRSIGAAGSTVVPSGAAYLRRWSVAPQGARVSDPVILQVVAIPKAMEVTAAGYSGRHRGEARAVAIVTRRP